ncbi:MAG: GNAT family N-acetyltransferase [Verrucomicrobia bacterium]|nr:MAG: GNAT family N-acetyltransferase [Verrucomicrobiota bacterium]
MSFAPPALIAVTHQVETFDCGVESLNLYLNRFALMNTTAGIARTYVSTPEGELVVVGYYSLAAGSVERAAVPERIAKGIPQHPVPVVLLARLAVDRHCHGRGLGKGLLRDALQRALAAANVIGVRAVLVHAKDQKAASFYGRYGFVPSPTDPLHLMLLMKDLRRTLENSRTRPSAL